MTKRMKWVFRSRNWTYRVYYTTRYVVIETFFYDHLDVTLLKKAALHKEFGFVFKFIRFRYKLNYKFKIMVPEKEKNDHRDEKYANLDSGYGERNAMMSGKQKNFQNHHELGVPHLFNYSRNRLLLKVRKEFVVIFHVNNISNSLR